MRTELLLNLFADGLTYILSVLCSWCCVFMMGCEVSFCTTHSVFDVCNSQSEKKINVDICFECQTCCKYPSFY